MPKSFLSEIKDGRRKEGRRYEPGYILLFSVFAVLSGAVSYRQIHTFIRGHYEMLKEKSGLKRKRIPAYTAVRNIITGLQASDVEECFRKYSLKLPEEVKELFTACGGKTLRRSYDNFTDKKAVGILSAFLPESGLIPARSGIEEKTDGIPVFQELVKEPGLTGRIFDCDAVNCREKTLKAVKENSNDVIVCVRGSRKILLNGCRDTYEMRPPCSGYTEAPVKERNRTESGEIRVFNGLIGTDKKTGKILRLL